MKPASKSEQRRESAVLRKLRELRDQAQKQLADAGDRLTQTRLSAESNVSVTTLSDWFTGKHTPRDVDQLLAVAAVLAGWANAPRMTHRYWTNLMESDRALDSVPDQADEPVPAGGDKEPWAQGPGQPLSEFVDPFALEVHRAIDVGSPHEDPTLPVLPVYVERQHDLQLRKVIRQAVEGRSTLAVLVGGSSSGKTRACWEAVHQLPSGWRLWHPIDPERPEAAIEDLSKVGPCTVVWLNETQHYLLTPGSRLGGHIAAGLRSLLGNRDRAPVLVLGTIWPEYWDILTHVPRTDEPDPHPQARALLTSADIAVPAVFSGRDLEALRAEAVHDPRLALAAKRAEQGQIAQYLAGAPALLERYRTAPDGARAVLDASIDARRLGHGLAISYTLLEASAPVFLTDQQWDSLGEDWLEQALAYAASPCRGARGPLTRMRPRPGEPAPAQPHYRLADYLEQRGRELRRAAVAPAGLWHALCEYATGDDLNRLARSATENGLLRVAVHLYSKAAQAGDARALTHVASLLEETERPDEALLWWQRAAEAGQSSAVRQVATILQAAGRTDEALTWLQQQAEAGDNGARRHAAVLLEAAGRTEEALLWWQQAAEAGETSAVRQVATILQAAGRTDEALTWLQQQAEAGDNGARRHAAALLEAAGRTDEALTWFDRAATSGDGDSLWLAVAMLTRVGRADDALTWLQAKVTGSDNSAMQRVSAMLEEAGRPAEALTWLQRAAEAGDSYARTRVALILEEAGRVDEALAWLQPTAKAGDIDALGLTIAMLNRAGRADEALAWLEIQARADGSSASRHGAVILEEAGRSDEALAWLQRTVDAGDSNAVWPAVALLEETGRVDEALTVLQQAPGAGDSGMLRAAAAILARADRVDEALVYLQRACDAGDDNAPEQAATILAGQGRHIESLAWLQDRAECGETRAVHLTADTLMRIGRVDEALIWLQRASDAGDGDATEQAAMLLEETGHADEALVLLGARAEAGDVAAISRLIESLERSGRIDQALTWLYRATAPSHGFATTEAIRLLERVGMGDRAAGLKRYGWEPGGAIAEPWEAPLPSGVPPTEG